MSKEPSRIEWRIEDEASNWPPPPDSTWPDSALSARPSPRRLSGYYIFAAIALLFLLLTTGIWIWVKAQHGVTQIEDDLKDATRSELWLARNAPARLPVDPNAKAWHPQFHREDNTLIAFGVANADLSPALDLHLKSMQNNIAVVDIVLHGKNETQSFRQTRFYRQSTTGWLRTAPDAAQWGAPRHLESTYFVFDFRQEDAEVVIAAAPKVDALYTTLRNNLGLTGDPTQAKQRIEVSANVLPGASFTHLDTTGTWRVPSPSLYLAPITVTKSELLLQSLAFPLLSRLLAEAIQRYRVRPLWGPVISALRLWQLWNLSLPLSTWRQDIIQWRYVTLPNAAYGEASVLPDDYLELCAMHALWMTSPVQIDIPLPCNDPANTQSLSAPPLIPNGSRPPTTLLAIIATGARQVPIAQGGNYSNSQSDNTVAMETLLEYIASVYGTKAVPTFLAGMKSAGDWESLSRSTLSISSADLLAGWQDYLSTHYAVPSRQFSQSK